MIWKLVELKLIFFIPLQFLNVLALSFLAVIIRNPAMIHELENGNDEITLDQNDPPALPTPLSKIDPPFAYRDHSLNYRKYDELKNKIINYNVLVNHLQKILIWADWFVCV